MLQKLQFLIVTFLKENPNQGQDYNTEKENMNFEKKRWNVIGYKIKIEHLCTIYD